MKKNKPRIHSRRPVGASLDPATMAKYIQDFYGEQGQRIDARTKLQSALAADPGERAVIARQYQENVQGRTGALAAHGLSERGFSAGDLVDIERTRVLAETDHASKLRAAQAEYTSVIANLNTQRAAEDANYATIAGQNIQAGTGKFKHRKPKGWTPPSLQRTADVDPNTGQPMPTAPGPKPTPTPPVTLGPTGARLPTAPAKAINYAKRVATARPKLSAGRVRLA